ncbi:hypothetical protein Pcinc_041054 [Petrolisthes cinctipes]|uniref:Protein sleepless n=1 Tax=Petrolisthes cinctipes TaxID=88211 RepID=A0AAE1EI58_PETCI|nr:hypothetical protein Pcinc_041054 [Petrolisthes cinctipes]
MMKFVLLVIFSALLSVGNGLWCYRCVGSHPGCGLYDFDWRYYWSHYCPDPNDKCVKVIEQRESEVMVTRDCLSYLEGHRRDIPADRYEGCRSSATDHLLGQFIFPSIPEIDHRREHYTNVTFCFCDFDERCNHSPSLAVSYILSISLLLSHLLL